MPAKIDVVAQYPEDKRLIQIPIVIGVPDTPVHCSEFSWSLLGLQMPLNVDVRWRRTGQDPKRGPIPVDRARNEICRWAIDMNARYLFFIDNDVIVPPFALRRLFYTMQHHPELSVIGGVYTSKTHPPEPLIFRGHAQGAFWDWTPGEIFPIDGIGMGCTMIRVADLFKMKKPWFKTLSTGLETGGKLMRTEDLWFCKRVRDSGLAIRCDSAIQCAHWNKNDGIYYRLLPDAKPFLRQQKLLHALNSKLRIVDLGCGETYVTLPEGKPLRVDIRHDVNPDFQADVTNLPDDWTEQYDIAFSSHTLEHFSREMVHEVIDEWKRIIKPSGELRLVLPNLEWAAEKIGQGIVDNDVLNVLYGQQDYRENFHKTGFTTRTIRELLEEHGFIKIGVERQGDTYNMLVRAYKPEEATEQA